MAIFREIAKFIYRVDSWKSENSLLLWLLWFSLKNDNLGLKIFEILKFLGIQPKYGHHRTRYACYYIMKSTEYNLFVLFDK